MRGTPRLPDIFEYLDYRTFLLDWFRARKRAWPEFSYEYVARRVGLRSRTSVQYILNGDRKPSEATAGRFTKLMGLDALEGAYFLELVKLGRARSARGRRAVLISILEDERFGRGRRLEFEPPEVMARYLGRWYHAAIRELARDPGFREDPAWLAATLNPPISRAQAAEALTFLLEEGFLIHRDDGTLEVRELWLSTRGEAFGRAIYQHHRQLLENAAYALDHQPPAARHFQSATLLVDEFAVEECKEMIADFTRALASICDAPSPRDKHLYQLGIQLFSLTASPGEE